MIELAAACWDVSPATAVRKLIKSGIPIPPERAEQSVINKYVVEHPQYRNRLNSFLDKAGEYLPKTDSPVLNGLREKFRLASQMSQSRWIAGPGQMMGAYPHLAVEKVFMPNSVIGGRCVSDTRMFKGRKWGDVMVIPHYDLPGRVCGFLFVGRGGNRGDMVFRIPNIQNNGANVPTYAEGGLACHWAIENSHGMFGDHVVACGDPYLAMRLHIRHFSVSKTPLPLIAYHDGGTARTSAAWKSLDHKIPVLWGWRLTPSLLCQAILSDGKIALTELEDTSQFRIDHFVRNAETKLIIQRVVKHAKPWREFLTEWADRVDDGPIEELLCGLEAYGINTNTLSELGPRFAELARMHGRPREVRVGTKTVIEKDGKWWCGHGRRRKHGCDLNEPSLVMNAMLRIDGSSLKQSGGYGMPCSQYKGRLIHEGTEIPFEMSMRTLKSQTQDVLSDVLIRNKPGSVLYVAEGWRGKLVEAAILFSGVL